MNFTVKAFKIIHENEKTMLEDYVRDVPNYTEAQKERNRLLSLGNFTNIVISKKEREN
jgi:hypothetical protein